MAVYSFGVKTTFMEIVISMIIHVNTKELTVWQLIPYPRGRIGNNLFAITNKDIKLKIDDVIRVLFT